MADSKLHQGQPIEKQGVPLQEAKAVMIMLHGRGAGAGGMLPLIQHFEREDFAYLIPNAADLTWYPERFLVSREKNEPKLSSALTMIHDLLSEIKEAGISPEKIMLLGFSQGACLALEYAARHPQKIAAIVALSGGLIGADDELVDYIGSLTNIPIFIGCSDVDFHIPVERVHQSVKILRGLGAQVDERIYPNMGHTINMDEVQAVNQMMKALVE
jgi:phospholipase/carboxylesterase